MNESCHLSPLTEELVTSVHSQRSSGIKKIGTSGFLLYLLVPLTYEIGDWDLNAGRNSGSCSHCHSNLPHVWCNMNTSCYVYEWVMSHMSMSHVMYIDKSCHIYKGVMSRIWTSHLICMNKSRQIHWQVLIQISVYVYVCVCVCVSHTHTHKYEWGILHTHMRRVICINESCHMYKWVMLRI